MPISSLLNPFIENFATIENFANESTKVESPKVEYNKVNNQRNNQRNNKRNNKRNNNRNNTKYDTPVANVIPTVDVTRNNLEIEEIRATLTQMNVSESTAERVEQLIKTDLDQSQPDYGKDPDEYPDEYPDENKKEPTTYSGDYDKKEPTTYSGDYDKKEPTYDEPKPTITFNENKKVNDVTKGDKFEDLDDLETIEAFYGGSYQEIIDTRLLLKSLLFGLMFYLLANKETYKLTRELTKNMDKVLIHAVIFAVIYYIIQTIV